MKGWDGGIGCYALDELHELLLVSWLEWCVFRSLCDYFSLGGSIYNSCLNGFTFEQSHTGLALMQMWVCDRKASFGVRIGEHDRHPVLPANWKVQSPEAKVNGRRSWNFSPRNPTNDVWQVGFWWHMKFLKYTSKCWKASEIRMKFFRFINRVSSWFFSTWPVGEPCVTRGWRAGDQFKEMQGTLKWAPKWLETILNAGEGPSTL